jgi:hypothetical protein
VIFPEISRSDRGGVDCRGIKWVVGTKSFDKSIFAAHPVDRGARERFGVAMHQRSRWPTSSVWRKRVGRPARLCRSKKRWSFRLSPWYPQNCVSSVPPRPYLLILLLFLQFSFFLRTTLRLFLFFLFALIFTSLITHTCYTLIESECYCRLCSIVHVLDEDLRDRAFGATSVAG